MVDKHGMNIVRAGASMISSAQFNLNQAAEKLVREPADPEQLVKLSTSVDEGKIGAKLIEAGEKMADTLLDVLA